MLEKMRALRDGRRIKEIDFINLSDNGRCNSFEIQIPPDGNVDLERLYNKNS